MARHPDFEKIHNNFVQRYETKAELNYQNWLVKKIYDETKEFPHKQEQKESIVRGFEFKETDAAFYVKGLVATSHVDKYHDIIPKETLESFAQQINTQERARVMGIYHSEGLTGEYGGIANFEETPARVIPLADGEHGLYVETKILKDDAGKQIQEGFQDGKLTHFSITYNTEGSQLCDFNIVNDEVLRVIKPESQLYGYTATGNHYVPELNKYATPANDNAIAVAMDYKEFKEVMIAPQEEATITITTTATENPEPVIVTTSGGNHPDAERKQLEAKTMAEQTVPVLSGEDETTRGKLEIKEMAKHHAEEILKLVGEKLEVKEKVLREDASQAPVKELSLEVKDFLAVIANPEKIELKEQFRRSGAIFDKRGLSIEGLRTKTIAERLAHADTEFKHFGVNGTQLEYKGLGITSNQNTDTDYLLSSAELQDVFDPVIYNLLNQEAVTWNLLEKDDCSKKGNNQVQFTAKYAVNGSRGFYVNNTISTDKASRLKFQTKFKKAACGISVDGDMVAAARGGPIGDVFAQEVYDATMDLLQLVNQQLFLTKGAETDAEIIGFEYIANSATYTSLYNLTRSATLNRLSPDAAGDTYINAASLRPTMTQFGNAKVQAKVEGSNEKMLIWVTHPTQANLLRRKFDDQKLLGEPRATAFGFSTDLFIDGVPVFEDKDCPNTKWFLIDKQNHRVAIWVPPTIEKLGKTGDSDDGFLKMYFATYNRRPRSLVEIYSCATT